MENLEDKIKNKVAKLTHHFNNLIKTDSKLEFVSDMYENKLINIDDGRDKKIASVKYEILGIYDRGTNIFIWGCNTLNDKKFLCLSKKIKEYSKTLKEDISNKKYNDTEYTERIYYYLSNGMFFISNENIHDLLQFSIYVTECRGIISDSKNKSAQTFYLVVDTI